MKWEIIPTQTNQMLEDHLPQFVGISCFDEKKNILLLDHVFPCAIWDFNITKMFGF